MRITVDQIGKSFSRIPVFRNFSFEFQHNKTYAITGPNGAGKSTLLKIIAGQMLPDQGSVTYFDDHEELIENEAVFRKTAVAAPYLDLIEEFTLSEALNFHFRFKPLPEEVSVNNIVSENKLTAYSDKPVGLLSSGTKQKLKLILALYSNVPLLLLDEPGTNLDKENFAGYKQLVTSLAGSKLILVFSNNPSDYDFCDEIIDISQFK